MSLRAACNRLSRIAACGVIGFAGAFPMLVLAQPIPRPTTTTMPTTTPAVAPAVESPQAVLGQFAAAWARVTAYTATVTIFDRNGTQLQNVVLDYTFRKPASVAVHVDAGTNAGVTMLWDGGTTVVAHRGSGFAALFKKTFSLHDPQVTTLRGSSIDQLSFGAILAHARQSAGNLTQITGVDAVGVTAVTLISADPAANAGLSREVLKVSTSTHLPVQVLGYDGTTLVRKIDFSNVFLVR